MSVSVSQKFVHFWVKKGKKRRDLTGMDPQQIQQYAIFKNGCLATSGATVGERNKLELMTSQNIKLRIICKDAGKSESCILHTGRPKV